MNQSHVLYELSHNFEFGGIYNIVDQKHVLQVLTHKMQSHNSQLRKRMYCHNCKKIGYPLYGRRVKNSLHKYR